MLKIVDIKALNGNVTVLLISRDGTVLEVNNTCRKLDRMTPF
jgi:hypothetical protein